ncbi:MAG: N-acetyltransferase [Candidatus Baltobacteraceae bacterium]
MIRTPMLSTREEMRRDYDAIGVVHQAAFGRSAEAALVERLRDNGLIVVSMVAEMNDAIIGNVVFSALSIEPGATVAVALAPAAVLPPYQRLGIGTKLISAGLNLCRRRSVDAAIVLGDPQYYQRFGFSSALTSGLTSRYAGRHWMALELVPHALAGVAAVVAYPGAFTTVD